MPFDATIVHWPSISAFAAYLQGVPRPAWVRGICNHNSYEPSDLNWHGMASMTAMRDFYRDIKQWSSGPHLFLAAKAPNAADTGIFQMTPITRPGTHAGACNATMLGVEWVGDFEKAPPSADQYTLGIAINLIILQYWGMPPSVVNVHRDCMPGRTCPGKHLTSEQIRASLTAPAPPITKRYRVKSVFISQKQEGGAPYAGELLPGEVVTVDKWYTNGKVHLQDGRGFVALDALEAI